MYHSISSLVIGWLLPIIWMVLICPFTNDALSLSENSRILIPLLKWIFPDAPYGEIRGYYILTRKVGHFLVYSILAWLLFRALRGQARLPWKRRWVVTAAVIAIAYAVFDEYAQSFIPTRTASAFDVLIDTGGVLVTLTALSLFLKSRSKGSWIENA